MQPHDTTNDIPYGYCQCGCGEKTSIAKKHDRSRGWVKGEPLRYINHHQHRTPQDRTEPANPSGYCMCGCGQKTDIVKSTERRRGNIKGEPFRYIRGHAKRKAAMQSFAEHVDKNGPNGCWIWTAAKNNRGYGIIAVNRHSTSAHRFSYELHNGPIPDGLDVLHKCDNPPCCNPEHLFLGTQRDNSQDMHQKGRGSIGENRPLAKLTPEKVKAIRKLIAQGVSQRDVANEFNVSRGTIGDVALGRTWKHVV